MDPMVKLMYRMLHSLDVDRCVGLVGKLSDFQVARAGTPRISLPDYLSERHRVVTIDNASTKDMIPTEDSFLKMRYVEMVRVWGILSEDGRPFGYTDRLNVYNGFPTVIKPEEFAEDPNGAFQRGLDELLRRDDPRVLFAPIEISSRLKVHVLKEFYDGLVTGRERHS
jgi:hypothetical protein